MTAAGSSGSVARKSSVASSTFVAAKRFHHDCVAPRDALAEPGPGSTETYEIVDQSRMTFPDWPELMVSKPSM